MDDNLLGTLELFYRFQTLMIIPYTVGYIIESEATLK